MARATLQKQKKAKVHETNGHAVHSRKPRNRIAKIGASDPVKLNLGSGTTCLLDGYVNLDCKFGQEIYPLPYADESVDEIRASHVLEHFEHSIVLHVVREWARVLKPGGVLKVAVPDFKWISENYLAGKNFPVQSYTMGGQIDADDFHKAIFDRDTLKAILNAAGLVDVQRWKSGAEDCASYDVSLNLCAFKSQPIPPVKIKCAMSVPRLGFQDNFFSWSRALLPLGIVPTKYDGAFWGQCLERTLISLVDTCDWILCIDYDSVFSADSVSALVRLVVQHPYIDAIAGIQMMRGKDGAKPLLVIRTDGGAVQTQIADEEMQDPLLRLDTAHFGMTLIKTEALKKMPHPWFQGFPNKEGLWDEGRMDDDIYFWNKWKSIGNSLYSANRVVVGHAELMFTWPDRSLNPIHQYPNDFWEKGIPESVWE